MPEETSTSTAFNNDRHTGSSVAAGITVTPPQSQNHSSSTTQGTLQHPAISRIQGSVNTPVKVGTGSKMSSEHFHKNIKAFIINDLNNSTDHVSHEVWAEAVLRVTPAQLKAWSSAIRTQNWFEDPDIRPQLDAYCDVSHETERYEPFCKIANKILKLALDELENVPKTYPIADLTFVRNDPVYLRRNSDLHARIKPDVLCIRGRDRGKLERGEGKEIPGLEWSNVLLFCEFKAQQYKLTPRRLSPDLASDRSAHIRAQVSAYASYVRECREVNYVFHRKENCVKRWTRRMTGCCLEVRPRS